MADPLVRTIEVVRVSDPALAMSVSERRAYGESRDPSAIRELPGQRAVRFVVRPLSSIDAAGLERVPAGAAQLVMAFVFGVVEIREANELGPNPDTVIRPTQRIKGRDLPVWSDDQLTAIQEAFGRVAILEIGGVAYERMLRGKAAGGSVPYTVPQASLEELEHLERQHAATLGQTPDETSSG